jgi:uncharacterized protein DUF5309
MAAVTNTFTTPSAKGIREDLSNLIANISPTEAPFTANAGTRPRAKQTFYEWQLDSLATVDTANAQAEGNDISTFPAIVPTSRVGNYCQISQKQLVVSATLETVDKAGRKSELAYQIAKKGKEMKRDIEATVLSRNTGAVNTDPRATATMLSYVRTNTDKGATGADPAAPAPTYAGARTDGTQRAFTETILKNIIALGFASGMKIDGAVLMLGTTQKGVFSTFAGIATKFKDIPKGQATVVGASDVYVSDFGEITVVPNRFQRNRDGWLLDFDLIGFKDLRPYEVIDLAKTGDATKKLLNREWSLQVDVEAGQALAADLT